MRDICAVLAVCLLAGACAGQATFEPGQGFSYDQGLIDGATAFGSTVPAAPALDLLAVSPRMQPFIENSVRPSGLHYNRIRRLLQELEKQGYFIGQYNSAITTTASETFDHRQGNCLAYTNMFIALAWASGLQASYQVAYVDPVWDVEEGFLVRKNHINVLVDSVRIHGIRAVDLTVDFNDTSLRDGTRQRRVSDEYTQGLHHSNMAIEQLYLKDFRQAFAHLKRAIIVNPSNPDLWNNLGTLYSVIAEDELAKDAYATALAINPKSQPAIAGLAKSHRRLNDLEAAQHYDALKQKRLERNPYYHYASAQSAFREEAFEAALVFVDEAIRLKRRDPQFHELRATTAAKLGDDEAQAKSLKLYHKYSKGSERRDRTLDRMLVVNPRY